MEDRYPLRQWAHQWVSVWLQGPIYISLIFQIIRCKCPDLCIVYQRGWIKRKKNKSIQVFDATQVNVYGLNVGLVGQQLKFSVNTAQAGVGDLEVPSLYFIIFLFSHNNKIQIHLIHLSIHLVRKGILNPHTGQDPLVDHPNPSCLR